MARSPLEPRRAVWAVTAAVAVAVLTAAPASARPAAPAKPGPASPAACQAADLNISVPAAIPGDPAEGMGTRAWNIVFRATGRTPCYLRGWPGIQVRTGGKKVAASISDVSFSNIAPIRAGGRRAGARRQRRRHRHVAHRSARMRDPAGARTDPARDQSSGAGDRAGRLVRALRGRAAAVVPLLRRADPDQPDQGAERLRRPAGVPRHHRRRPAACTSAALAADVTSIQSGSSGAIIELRLSASGGPCVLPGGWPTVRLDEAGGANQVAKIFPDTAAVAASKSLLTTYEHGPAQNTALTLTPACRCPLPSSRPEHPRRPARR